jgi:hypothetical protein
MKKYISIANHVLLGVMCFSAIANATTVSPIRQARAIYYGPDCDERNTVAVFAEDFSSFSLIFSELSTSTDAVKNNKKKRVAPEKNCTISIAFEVDSGFQVEVDQVDYRGYINVPTSKTAASISSQHFFVNGSVLTNNGRILGNRLPASSGVAKVGPFEGDVVWSSRYRNVGRHASACNGSEALALKLNLRASSRDRAAEAFVALDTADANISNRSVATYRIQVKRCDAWNRARKNSFR